MKHRARAFTMRYAVIGTPIEHSQSPWIHRCFAAQLGEHIDYAPLQAPLDGFAACARRAD
ncbi:hypothetical protein [Candidatus Glomeribacter gigasporarum]|uniref:hypothetical protein n=1 Tax=Candidatus Glomeribacter gigasporarum TaxID=132144 RepID=UPI0009D9C6A6